MRVFHGVTLVSHGVTLLPGRGGGEPKKTWYATGVLVYIVIRSGYSATHNESEWMVVSCPKSISLLYFFSPVMMIQWRKSKIMYSNIFSTHWKLTVVSLSTVYPPPPRDRGLIYNTISEAFFVSIGTCFYSFTVDCEWLEWGAWQVCNVTCGDGYQQRMRERNAEQHGGLPCEGRADDWRDCKLRECPGTVFTLIIARDIELPDVIILNSRTSSPSPELAKNNRFFTIVVCFKSYFIKESKTNMNK